MPRLPSALICIDNQEALNDRKSRDKNMKMTFDKNSHSLPRLEIGDNVLIQDHVSKKWSKQGQVYATDPDGRSYVIKFKTAA